MDSRGQESVSVNLKLHFNQLGNEKIYANVSEEFHKFVEALKGREEQKLRLDETFQVVEVSEHVRQAG